MEPLIWMKLIERGHNNNTKTITTPEGIQLEIARSKCKSLMKECFVRDMSNPNTVDHSYKMFILFHPLWPKGQAKAKPFLPPKKYILSHPFNYLNKLWKCNNCHMIVFGKIGRFVAGRKVSIWKALVKFSEEESETQVTSPLPRLFLSITMALRLDRTLPTLQF